MKTTFIKSIIASEGFVFLEETFSENIDGCKVTISVKAMSQINSSVEKFTFYLICFPTSIRDKKEVILSCYKREVLDQYKAI